MDFVRHESGLVVPTQGVSATVGDMVKTTIRTILNEAKGTAKFHAEMVAGGPDNFRETFFHEMGAFFGKDRGACDDIAKVTFEILRRMWIDMYTISASKFLDGYEEPSPPTQKEIDDAWELEIAGSEEAMRVHYEGSQRTRKGADLGSKRTGG